MRALGVCVAGLLALTPSRAAAESGEEMRARGEQLAKDGRYTEAIDAFKAAHRIEPRARHFCLIALAYIRRELWPQAEIFLEQCEAQATPADPVPEWVPVAKQQLAERLATVHVAAIEIQVEPAGVDVKLAVSSFAPDELFTPRTIHLPPGRHVIIATAQGYDDAQKTVEVTDKGAQKIVITMLPLDAGGTGPDGPRPVVDPPPRSKVPLIVMGAGGAIVLGAVAAHTLWYWPLRKDLAAAGQIPDEDAYRRLEPRYERARKGAIGLYVAGGVTAAVGAVLYFTVFAPKATETSPQVSLVPTDGGGMLTVGWSR